MPQIWTRSILEPAPNHDFANPCFTAWELTDYKPNESTPVTSRNRPKWSFQMYATTPEADDEAYLRAVVQKIFKETQQDRGAHLPEYADRIDLYGLPMPAGTPTGDRVARCIEHQKAEIESRHGTGLEDFFISHCRGYFYNRMIIIIDTWDDSDGTLIWVEFDKLERFWEDHDYPDPRSRPISRGALGEALFEPRTSIGSFYVNYVLGGLMKEELERCSGRAVEDILQYIA
ncbi:hypothetical protein F5Y11DRAFT_203781 [Daldinia sp. FL1419]|nr:hypothetical protein F5Y11DRAFT_203781 [Daldinia sp. FL1419]